VVCIPQRGGTKTPEREAYEKSREFKDGQRFRAGIEGRISVVFRGRGMKRGAEEAFGGAAVVPSKFFTSSARRRLSIGDIQIGIWKIFSR